MTGRTRRRRRVAFAVSSRRHARCGYAVASQRAADRKNRSSYSMEVGGFYNHAYLGFLSSDVRKLADV